MLITITDVRGFDIFLSKTQYIPGYTYIFTLKYLPLTDLMFIEKRVSLMSLIMESLAIKIMFLDRGYASQLYTLLTEIRGNIDLFLHIGFR